MPNAAAATVCWATGRLPMFPTAQGLTMNCIAVLWFTFHQVETR